LRSSGAVDTSIPRLGETGTPFLLRYVRGEVARVLAVARA